MVDPRTSDADLLATLRADIAANAANPKGRLVTVAFRLAHVARGAGRPPLWSVPVVGAYRLVIDWIMGIELPPTLQAGPGLRVWHGTGLVVHSRVQLGSGVTLRQGVTLGTLTDDDDAVAPVIGDRVSIGAGAIVLGPITIGDDAIIGAGAVVVDDVPAGATAVGNPARVLPTRVPPSDS